MTAMTARAANAWICGSILIAAPTRNDRGGILLVPNSCQTALSLSDPTWPSLPCDCHPIESRSSPVSSKGVFAILRASVSGNSCGQP
jgi:hypothetical protein